MASFVNLGTLASAAGDGYTTRVAKIVAEAPAQPTPPLIAPVTISDVATATISDVATRCKY